MTASAMYRRRSVSSLTRGPDCGPRRDVGDFRVRSYGRAIALSRDVGGATVVTARPRFPTSDGDVLPRLQ